MPIIIAIDGPSASGKGTIARKLALLLGFPHLDTGLLYRATAMAVLRADGDASDVVAAEKAALALRPEDISPDDENLRSDIASVAASKVAAIPAVRAALLKFQQNFCLNEPGAVLDGRDVGTVIAPSAQVKIFVTASTDARTDRRFKELQSRNLPTSREQVLADMIARDKRDAEREVAPAKPADDAVMLDTTHLTAAQALQAAIEILKQAGVKA